MNKKQKKMLIRSADRGLFLTAGRGIPEICSFYDPISGYRL